MEGFTRKLNRRPLACNATEKSLASIENSPTSLKNTKKYCEKAGKYREKYNFK
jgi:hypothetical protein